MPYPADDSFLQLVEPHRRALRLHCYRMLGSPQDVDDMIQETIVRAWQARGSLEDPKTVRPWLYRIATNVCFDELKRRKNRPLPSDVVAHGDLGAPVLVLPWAMSVRLRLKTMPVSQLAA